jgi:RNA polymerase sigma factor (sigma-70 family)
MSKKSEELSKLWNEVCAGNERAYSLIHQKLYSKLYTYGKRIIKDDELVNDVLQETFIKLWMKKESLASIENVEAYFFVAMRSFCINSLRTTKAIEVKKQKIAFLDIQDSIEDIITQREIDLKQRRIIDEALNKLPSRQREIMQLRFFESLNCSEIGELTGIKYQSVYNHMHRAVQTLRELYSSEDQLRVA